MLELQVCIGSACHLKGAYNVLQTFQKLIEERGLHEKITLSSQFCMKRCSKEGVSVSLNGEGYNIIPENAKAFFQETVLFQL